MCEGACPDGVASGLSACMPHLLESRRVIVYAIPMKRTPVLASAIILLLLWDGLAPVRAEPANAEHTFHTLPLRLAQPQWRPLTGQQITALISDRTIVIDTTYEPYPGAKVNAMFRGGCPPYETFFADGRWQMGMCQRAYRVYEGRWITEAFRGGERLCVDAIDRPKECRFVWQGSTADQIVMALATRAEVNELNEDYSPYRLTKSRE